MKQPISVIVILVIALFSSSCELFAEDTVILTVDHNLYVGGYACYAYVTVDYGKEVTMFSEDVRDFEVETGTVNIQIEVYKRKYMFNDSEYEYHGRRNINRNIQEDTTIRIYREW